MRFYKSIHAIDSHTMGEPTRIIVGGVPSIPGKTMAEKKEYLQKNMDDIRTGIMLEPRGHNDMFGSILTTAVSEEADFGVIFMDGGGYLNMCGHGSIGAVTAAIETGIVEMKEPVTYVNFDTPAGFIKAEAQVKNGKVQEVSIVNVPAFLYKRDQEIEMEGYGKIKFDISFGGSFFAIVEAKQFGLEIVPANANKLKDLGIALRDKINQVMPPQHPTLAHIKTVDLVEFFGPAQSADANYRNVVVFGQGQVDRSPCGTGTSAKLATLFAKDQIKEGEPFVYESIIGTKFKGEIVGTGKIGEFTTVTPKITGAAYITGFNHFVFDQDDPVVHGFLLG